MRGPHAQERSLVDRLLPGAEPGDLWIADRPFCATRRVFSTRARGGGFLLRQHKSTLHSEEAAPWAEAGRVATRTVSEQTVAVTEAAGGGAMTLRLGDPGHLPAADGHLVPVLEGVGGLLERGPPGTGAEGLAQDRGATS